ncbi:MAG: CHAT domain-containing protein [Acidobacteriota bacterium]
MRYFELVVQVVPRDTNTLAITVVQSPRGGDNEQTVTIDIEGLPTLGVDGLLRNLTPLPTPIRGGRAPRHAAQRLFATLLNQHHPGLFDASRTEAKGKDAGLRLRLRLPLDGADGIDPPWELLHDGTGYLALDPSTPVVRSLLHFPTIPVAQPKPLDLLVVTASPDGCDPLSIDDELKVIRDANDKHGLAPPQVIDQASLEAIDRALERHRPNTLHIIAHGDFDDDGDAVLLFAGADGEARRIGGQDLAELVRLHDLRLVVLNTCHGGSSPRAGDPFTSIVASLLRAGVPAVIAMQREIDDRAAVLFADTLYQGLGAGKSLEEAVARARKALWRRESNHFQWAVPVLYLQTETGDLFAEPVDTMPITPIAEPKPKRSALLRHPRKIASAVVAVTMALIVGSGLMPPDEQAPTREIASPAGELANRDEARRDTVDDDSEPIDESAKTTDPDTKIDHASKEDEAEAGPREPAVDPASQGTDTEQQISRSLISNSFARQSSPKLPTVPDDPYYAGLAKITNAELVCRRLKALVRETHQPLPYLANGKGRDTWSALHEIQEDPENQGQLIDFFDPTVPHPIRKNDRKTYSREHIWGKAHGFPRRHRQGRHRRRHRGSRPPHLLR